jgi:hydrogenase maturation protease
MSREAPRILVAGIGNIFLGDDAFGVEVVAQLAKRKLPEAVRVIDFGIRAIDLTFALLDDFDVVILVDAVPRGGSPGQVYVIEAAVNQPQPMPDPAASLIELHRLDPAKVLQLVAAFNGHVDRLLVVGCEPTPLDESGDIQPGMSSAARDAIPVALEILIQLLEELTGSQPQVRVEPWAEPAHAVN